MKISVKCSSNGSTLLIDVDGETATVLNLKELISLQVEVPATQQRLIYSGKVLKDAEKLASYSVVEGHTVHMVRGAQPQRPPAAPAPTPAPTPAPAAPAPAPPAGMPFNPLLAGMGGGMGSGMGGGMGGGMAGGMGGGGFPLAAGGLGGAPGMLGGMDPGQVMNMMQNPAMQQMATALMQDPQALQSLQQMMQSTMGGNGAGNYMQHMQQVMSNPAMQQAVMQMMSDPQMQQMMFQQVGNMTAQGQGGQGGQGFGGLGAFGGMPLLGMGGFQPPAAGGTAPPQTPTAPPVSSAAPPATPTQTAPGADFNSMLSNVFANINTPPTAGGIPAANAGAAVSPAIRYASQISQLCDMGFFDADANLRALVATNGNVNAAVERLLSGV